MKPILVFHFSLFSVCACLCMPSPPPCPVSGAKEPSLWQSPECWELTFPRGQWEQVSGQPGWASPAL